MDGRDPTGDDAPADIAGLRLLVDTQLELERAAAKVRSGSLSTFALLVVFAILVERFVFLVRSELVLLATLPLLVLAAGYVLDRWRYQRAIARIGERLRAYAADGDDPRLVTLAGALEVSDGHDATVVLVYYALPLAVTAALVAWRFA